MGKNPIAVGDAAPDFTWTLADGTTRSLADFRGHSAVVLFFYPKDHTSVCTAEACSFRDNFAAVRAAGAEILGISGDSAASHDRFREEHGLPFPLVSDGDRAIRRSYGVGLFGGLIPGRTTFVIDRQGIVRHAHSGLFQSDRHVQEAIAALERLN